jgi:3-hydroxyisobutyrate dehydrogenase-like beta-hydroxyacid dehydrogenase
MSDRQNGPPLAGRSIGLIGLGLMGRPMAFNLLKAGATLHVWSRSRGPVDAVAAAGARAEPNAAALTRASDVIILMVTDTPGVRDVLHRADGVFAALTAGQIVVDMGTTEIPATRAFATEAQARGADYVDAPVSGGQVAAIDGTMTVMAGGSVGAFARALPVLSAVGRHITRVGEVGAGQIAKAANQMIVAMTIGAVAEAFAFAAAAGVEPGRVREAIRGGFAESRILELHGDRMVRSDYTPGGRARVQLKDLVQASDFAAAIGVDLPELTLLRAQFERLVAQGDGDLDHSALFRLWVRP